MPQQYNIKKPKANSNAGGGNAHNKQTNKEDPKDKSPNESKKRSTNLYHNGVSSPNINTWFRLMQDQELYKQFDYGWNYALFETMDPTSIKLPPLVGGEPKKPTELLDSYGSPNGQYDEIEKYQYYRQLKKHESRATEAILVYGIIQSKQDPSSIAICKQHSTYQDIHDRKDPVDYLKLIYKTHTINTVLPIHASVLSLKKMTQFRQLDNQSTTDYFEAFRRMMQQVNLTVPASMVPDEEHQAMLLLLGLSNHYNQLRQSFMSNPSSVPKTMTEMQSKIVQHIPLETVSQKTKNQSAFGTTTAKGSKSDNKGDQNKDKKLPPKDCPNCVKNHPDYPDKRHWFNECPHVAKALNERYGSSNNIQSSGISDSTSQSQPNKNHSSGVQPQPSSRNQQSVGLGIDQRLYNTTAGGGQGINNTAGGGQGRNYAIIASINYDINERLDSFNTSSFQPHKNLVILDPQSQVAIFNREDLVSNIRNSEITLTLHGMGNGSLLVTQIADHPVLGLVWFHPEASINVWQMRATESACNVELVKEYDRDLRRKVTFAMLATEYDTGIQHRFAFKDNLYVLEEGRQQLRVRN